MRQFFKQKEKSCAQKLSQLHDTSNTDANIDDGGSAKNSSDQGNVQDWGEGGDLSFEDKGLIGVDENDAHAIANLNTNERVQSIMKNVVSKPCALQNADKNAQF